MTNEINHHGRVRQKLYYARLKSQPKARRSRLATARRLGILDSWTNRPERSLDGWNGPEILAWLEAWRAARKINRD